MAISETVEVSVSGAGELDALAGAADKAAQAFARLDELAGKGLDLGAAGGGADKLAASYEAAFAKIQAGMDKLDKSMADLGKGGGAGADAGAGKLAESWDAAAGDVSGSIGKIIEDQAKLADSSAGDAAAAAGPGKIAKAWDDAAVSTSAAAAKIADSADAAIAAQAKLADATAATGAVAADGGKVTADANAAIADSSAAAAVAQERQAASAKATKTAQAEAAASAEASAKKYHMLALGGAAALAIGIDMAAKLQTGVTRLYTSAGESQKNLPMITQGILGMSGATNTSQANLAAGAYWTESAGFHGANALAVLKAGAQGAQAEGSDLPTTANALTTVLNDYFGGPQKSAAAQGKMATQAMNEIITSVGLGKMTLQGESAALPQVLPTAKQAGLALPQVLGAEATMTSEGTSAEQAAQEIRHTIGALQKPSNIQSAEMQMLGIDPVQLSKNLGKEGLTGTIEQVDTAIQKHMGPGGLIMLNTMNQSKLAVQSANAEIQAMPPAIQGVAKAYMAGTISAKAFNQEVFSGPESARDKALLSQFQTTASNALGFSSIIKSGLGDKQTQAAALSEIMGGQMGQQVALGVGGAHMQTFTGNVTKLGEAAQHTGANIQGWSAIQDTLNFKLGSFVKSAEAVATEVGLAALPAATDVMKGLGLAAGFLASHGTLTKDLLLGGGALAVPAILAKVASPVATGLGAVGKVAETLNIPGLDKLAKIGQGASSAGMTGAAGTVAQGGEALSTAAGTVAAGGEALSTAAGKLDVTGPGGLPGGKPGGSEPGGTPPLTPAETSTAEKDVVTGAEDVGGASLFAKLAGKGGPLAGLGDMAGPIGEGLVIGMVLKGLGDQVAPKGTPAGDYNKMFQQQAAQGGPSSQLHPNTLGGFEAWLTQHAGQQVGNVINRGLSQVSQMFTAPWDAIFGGGGHPATPAPKPGKNWTSVTGGSATYPGAPGGGVPASQFATPPPGQSPYAAPGLGTRTTGSAQQAWAAAHPAAAPMPAPDLLGGAGHPGTVTIKPKVETPDLGSFTAKLAAAMHVAPLKIPAPDVSSLKSAESAVSGFEAAIAQAMGKPVKVPSPDLSALKSATGAATAAGASAGAGFAAGISSETGAVTAAASALAGAAASAMSTRLVSHSPSEVTRKIGTDFDAGFSAGITGNTASVKAASAQIGSASVASLLQGLAGGQSNVQNAISAVMGAASNPDAVATIQQTFATLIGDVPAKDTSLVRYLTAQQGKLTALANKQGAIEAQITDAQQIATSAIGGAGITSAYGYEPALAASNGPLASQSLITGMGQQLADTKNFASQLQSLQKMGLNATTESQLAQAGTTAGLPLAAGLAQGGKAAVAQMNSIQAQIIKASQQIGSVGGTAMYNAGQAVTAGLDAPLKAELTALDKDMSKIANSIIATVEKKLGTKAAAATSGTGSSTAAVSTATAAGAASGATATAAGAGLSKIGAAASGAAGGLHSAGTAAGAAAGGLNSVAGAAGSAAAGLGKISSALAPLLAASQPAPAGGRAQPLGGGGYSAPSGGGGGGGSGNVTHVHVNVQGSLVQQQDLADHIQTVMLNHGSNNWNAGYTYPGRAF